MVLCREMKVMYFAGGKKKDREYGAWEKSPQPRSAASHETREGTDSRNPPAAPGWAKGNSPCSSKWKLQARKQGAEARLQLTGAHGKQHLGSFWE